MQTHSDSPLSLSLNLLSLLLFIINYYLFNLLYMFLLITLLVNIMQFCF